MIALYRRLLGPAFDELPPQVRALHDVDRPTTWRGRADVRRGDAAAARILATLLGLPPAGHDVPLAVTFTPRGEQEAWSRAFGARQFVSIQWADGGELRERVGPVTLHMTLQQDAAGLGLTLVAAHLLGVPVPGRLLPRIRTRESERDRRYRFEVEATMPLFGLLVRYEGWLERADR